MMTVKLINGMHETGYPCTRYDVTRILDGNNIPIGLHIELRPTNDVIELPRDGDTVYIELNGKTTNTFRWPPKNTSSTIEITSVGG